MCLCVSRYLSGRFSYEGLVPHKQYLAQNSLSLSVTLVGNMVNNTIYQEAGIEHHFMASAAYASYISIWVCGWKRITPSQILIDWSRKNDNLRLLWWSQTNCKTGVQRWSSQTTCKTGAQILAVTFIGRPKQLTRHLNVVIPTSLH